MKPRACCYEIRIEEPLDLCHSEWFSDVEMIRTESQTILRCQLPDQTALFGVLARVRDLNLTLISVQIIETQLK